MAKTLELQFVTAEGRTARVSVDNPNEPINLDQIKNVMDQIISDNAFNTEYGDFVTKKNARVIERNVVEYELN